jgi:hypothetical protein
MEEIHNENPTVGDKNKNQDCGCTDGSCQPKKKNIFSKVFFAVILLAAVAIIGVKLSGRSGNVSDKQSVVTPGIVPGCDTTKTKTCDTSKGSSCCPKK